MLCGHSESSYDSQMICNECIDDDENALAAADALADAVQFGDNHGREERLMAAMWAYRKARGDA